jgi:alpha-D-xyloside xylohydrolase
MLGWEMGVLNDKDDNSQLNYDRRPEDPQFYQVGATFKSPDDEHYYGLGENQEGYVDHRGHKIECWANYTAAGGASFCVPFLITNKGYGLLWDNPSKTTISTRIQRADEVGFSGGSEGFRFLLWLAPRPTRSTPDTGC